MLSSEQFEIERDYGTAMSVAKSLLKEGLINEQEYKKIKGYFIKKYTPIMDWIGNIQPETGRD